MAKCLDLAMLKHCHAPTSIVGYRRVFLNANNKKCLFANFSAASEQHYCSSCSADVDVFFLFYGDHFWRDKGLYRLSEIKRRVSFKKFMIRT